MDEHPDNPTENKLSTAVNEPDILAAVQRSGFPLQMIITGYLADACKDMSFSIQEEWGYIDRDVDQTRTIDINAEIFLYDPTRNGQRIRPSLNLLIECKQSDLPYLFFLSSNKHWLPYFPMFCGLFGDAVKIKEESDDSLLGKISTPVTVPITYGLGIDEHPFLTSPPAWCLTFSKCARKGKNLELTGSDPYLNLVLPLLKAAKHFHKVEKPPKTARYFDCHLILSIGILDAPMIGVHVSPAGSNLILLPWVRVIRHQSKEKNYWDNIAAIDVVHKDFFATYFENHAIPFANEFSQRALENQRILIKAVK